jgi:type IV pilus assembly protein PilE
MLYLSRYRLTSQMAGFNLIELMITVVIVAILASVALPSYSAYVVKTHRTAIQGDLQSLAQALEKRFVVEFSYLKANGGKAGAPVPSLFPDQGPVGTGRSVYRFDITQLSDGGYQLEAIPFAGSPQARDGKLTLDHTGKRCWYSNNSNLCTAW